MKLPQTAFDILMFLYNNPEYKTARDIVEIRNIKANLVSVNVEKLVQDGYICLLYTSPWRISGGQDTQLGYLSLAG